MFIDPLNSKFYSTVEDGYAWNSSGYSRTEASYTTNWTLDTNKTYCFEWRGYFAQDLSYLSPTQQATVIMQIHGTDPTISNGPPFELIINKDSLFFQENRRTIIGEVLLPPYPLANVYKAFYQYPISIIRRIQ